MFVVAKWQKSRARRKKRQARRPQWKPASQLPLHLTFLERLMQTQKDPGSMWVPLTFPQMCGLVKSLCIENVSFSATQNQSGSLLSSPPPWEALLARASPLCQALPKLPELALPVHTSVTAGILLPGIHLSAVCIPHRGCELPEGGDQGYLLSGSLEPRSGRKGG